MKASAKTKQIQSLIATAGSTFVSVTFEKKDGTERTIRFNPKYKRLVENPSEASQKATRARKENNPNLMAVIDIDLRQKGTPERACYRSINTETVLRMSVQGVVHEIK